MPETMTNTRKLAHIAFYRRFRSCDVFAIFADSIS